jgi:hypothetical protein
MTSGTSRKGHALQQAGLFALALAIYVCTLYPSFYTFDSAELAIGAATLGIVHSPGYALYLLLAHGFALLPFGDVGFRLNLLSAVATALTVPILYTALWHSMTSRTQRTARMPSLRDRGGRDAIFGVRAKIYDDDWHRNLPFSEQQAGGEVHASKSICALASLVFILGATVWHNGTIAEVYATQTLTLAAAWWALARLRAHRTTRDALLAGALFGVAVAMHPSSALLAPAVAAVFLALHHSWRDCLGAAALAVVIFAASLLYFPIRQGAELRMNFAGQHDDAGIFQAVDLRTPEGIVWLLRGEQFDGLFFYEGVIASAGQLLVAAHAFWLAYQGVGLLVVGVGLSMSFRRGLKATLLLWLLAFLPYIYFYLTYGAPDRAYMFGPAYLLLALPMAHGLAAISRWLCAKGRPGARVLLLLVPLLMALHSLRALGERMRIDVRGDAEAVMAALPQDALVFGVWGDVVTLEYLQILEGQRPDLTLRNLFFFDSESGVLGHIARQQAAQPLRPLVFLSDLVPTGLDPRRYTIFPLRVGDRAEGFIFVPRE